MWWDTQGSTDTGGVDTKKGRILWGTTLLFKALSLFICNIVPHSALLADPKVIPMVGPTEVFFISTSSFCKIDSLNLKYKLLLTNSNKKDHSS